jgi:hypothetical protein
VHQNDFIWLHGLSAAGFENAGFVKTLVIIIFVINFSVSRGATW